MCVYARNSCIISSLNRLQTIVVGNNRFIKSKQRSARQYLRCRKVLTNSRNMSRLDYAYLSI